MRIMQVVEPDQKMLNSKSQKLSSRTASQVKNAVLKWQNRFKKENNRIWQLAITTVVRAPNHPVNFPL